MDNNNTDYNIFYTSTANWISLKNIDDLIDYLCCMNEVYDQGIFCNYNAVIEYGPCSVSLKDESFPILTVKKITTVPLFNESQSDLMDKIHGEYIELNEETDEEYLNYYVSDNKVKDQLVNLFTNYERSFCKAFEIEVTHFSRDENNNIKRTYSFGQITLFKDYSGTTHHFTNLDLKKLLLGED
jgi:hypothetical protein